MRLFDLVEEDDGIGSAAHRLGQSAALLVADVSRRSADKAGDGELFHVLRHIDTHDILLVVEEVFGERLCKFRLAHARRA